MKKVFFLTFLLLASASLISACSRPPLINPQASQNNQQKGLRLPDFGQPERDPDMRGLVKSISGNEATILKVDLRGGFKPGTSTPEKGTSSQPASILPVGQGPREGLASRGSRDRASGSQRSEMLARMKEMSTGEEKITIPVGIKMLKPESGSTGQDRKMVEASLSDISADKIITVWLNQDPGDSKLAEFILIN